MLIIQSFFKILKGLQRSQTKNYNGIMSILYRKNKSNRYDSNLLTFSNKPVFFFFLIIYDTLKQH